METEDALIELVCESLMQNVREFNVGDHYTIRLMPANGDGRLKGWLVSKDGFPMSVSLSIREAVRSIIDSKLNGKPEAKAVQVKKTYGTRRLDIPSMKNGQEHHG